jgi:hypothetical protein
MRTSSQRGLSRAATFSTGASTTLEGCDQSKRSATFSGQMTADVGTLRMAMRVELEEHTRGSGPFQVAAAPGLGVWRASEPGVKIYKYIKQVTNLTAPATYRALISFRWTNAKGRMVREESLHTQACRQSTLTPTGPSGTTTSQTTSQTTSS